MSTNLNEWIAEMRRKRGWPRRVVAIKTGYTEQTVINWEKGKYKPTKAALLALEQAFGESWPGGNG